MNILRRAVGKCFHLFHTNAAKCFTPMGSVLMLHWIGDEKQDEETEPFRLSIREFSAFVSWLKKQNVIHLNAWEKLAEFWALTIDDVPENFYTNAYPLLKENGIPFTLFVNVSLLDKEGFITKEQLVEMSQCPLCTIGSHGVNHGEYALLNKKEAMNDLLVSKQELERIINKPVEMFAFPYGSYYACGYWNKHIAGEVYKYAFSTVACPITTPRLLKKYFLPRINVDVEFLNKL